MEDITIPKGYDAKIEGDKVVFFKKESEDEKIRKALIKLLNEGKDLICWAEMNGYNLKDAIAYLEKQKAKEKYDRLAPIYAEQESFESALDKAWKFYNKSASAVVDGCEDNYRELTFAKGFREGFLYKEKQKEQKSQGGSSEIPNNQWSEKDERMLERVIDTIGDSILECDCDDAGTKARFALEEERKWLKSIPERFK